MKTNFGFQNSQFGFTITGTPNIPIAVQATSDLAGGTWTPLQSCTLTNGAIDFIDPNSVSSNRFYSIAFP